MFKVFGLFVLIYALWSCINLPHETNSPETQMNCVRPGFLTCEEMTCRFRERGWLGATMNNTMLGEVLDHSSSDFPDWTAALQKAKSTCLVQDLSINVYNINCPAYDTAFCVIAALVKNAPRSTWTSEFYCESSRQYAETCPECPECVARSLHALPR